MTIAIISEYNIYSSIGGTESYVDMLLKGLVKKEFRVIFITQRYKTTADIAEKRKDLDGATVYFLPERTYSKAETRQKRISSTWPAIKKILIHEKAGLVHVHTHSTFFNFHHFEQLHQFRIPVFFTTHVPAHICSRGDLIRSGKQPCNGKVGLQCIACLFSKGWRNGVSGVVRGFYNYPVRLLQSLSRSEVQLVCVSEWQRDLVMLNGFPKERIQVIRQAIPLQEKTEQNNLYREGGQVSALRVGYLGRLSPEKGSALLLQIIEQLDAGRKFHFVLGIPATNSNPEDLARLYQSEAYRNGTITILDSITSLNKADFFNEIDCLLIPSFFWETGPIVLLESLAYGKPVVAVNLGGTKEYAIEFPGMVKTYEWGNVEDAKMKLLGMKEFRTDELTRSAIFNQLKEKESQFVQKHLDVYQMIKA